MTVPEPELQNNEHTTIMSDELITEKPEEKLQLAIATRIFAGRRSKKAKGKGDRGKERLSSKVVHVAWTRLRQRKMRKSAALENIRVETEVLAEFEGPTAGDQAREFIKLMPGRTRDGGGAVCCRRSAGAPAQTVDGWQARLRTHGVIVLHF